MRISAVVVIPARIAVNQADGVTNAITAVNVLKLSVIVETVARNVQQSARAVLKSVPTVPMMIFVVAVIPA